MFSSRSCFFLRRCKDKQLPFVSNALANINQKFPPDPMYRCIYQSAMEVTVVSSTGVPKGTIGYPELEGTHKAHKVQFLDILRPPQSPTSPLPSEMHPVSNPLCHENPISSIHVSVENPKRSQSTDGLFAILQTSVRC